MRTFSPATGSRSSMPDRTQGRTSGRRSPGQPMRLASSFNTSSDASELTRQLLVIPLCAHIKTHILLAVLCVDAIVVADVK